MKTNTSNLQEHEQLKIAHEFVQSTGRNVFLTGKAGTGKTTFLHRIRSVTDKRLVVVAPTGVAAINAGGVTIHSFFQLPFGPQIPEEHRRMPVEDGGRISYLPSGIKKFSREKLRIIRSLDLLVIDEISMVRADVLDSIDEVLRKLRRSSLPFGGVQVLLIGDLFQLSPVIKDDEWNLLRGYYNSVYFFDSKVFQKADFLHIELTFVFRQRDQKFIDLLNAVRNNQVNRDVLDQLNGRYISGFHPGEEEGYITLTTHNAKASEINQGKLALLKTPPRSFSAVIEGDFPEYAYPGEYNLTVKEGAQVMFIKNDLEAEKRFFNGKIGRIVEIGEKEIIVKCPGDHDVIHVAPVEWGNIKFAVNQTSLEVEEEVIGTFTQFPLRLAWAITIHKSQGLTFEKAIIDAQAAFAFGQVYVALSRCRSIEGLVLSSKINPDGIITDNNITDYTQEATRRAPDENVLRDSQKKFQSDLLIELFDFRRLRYRYSALQKLLSEHRAILDAKVVLSFLELEELLLKEVYVVADRFKIELSRLSAMPGSAEENEVLQERVKKAGAWFLQKIKEGLYIFMKDFFVECDNKAVRKILLEAVENFQKEIYLKVCCLEKSADGFQTLVFLKAKGSAMLGFAEVTEGSSRKSAQRKSPSEHADLFRELIAWRDETASAKHWEVSRIIHRSALVNIADALPQTIKQLLIIKGIGKKKVSDYGEIIIGKVREYCQKNGLQNSPEVFSDPKISSKIFKGDSARSSLELFSSGLSIAEVAAARALATTTIEGHLAFFVGRGEIDIHTLIDEKKLARISDYFLSPENTDALSTAKDFFGDEVTYGELRFVLQHLRFLHAKN